MIKSNLIPGEKISIEGDNFEVIKKTDRRKSGGYYEYILKPLEEDILSGVIHYFNSEKVVLEIARIIDCQMKGRTIQYRGKLYQISKEYDDVFYDKESDSMVREKVHELKLPKEKMFSNENPKKIVVKKDKRKIFYDSREITMNEFSGLKEPEDESGRKETIRFTYTFKEPVG